jgi:hypothetical protein
METRDLEKLDKQPFRIQKTENAGWDLGWDIFSKTAYFLKHSL